MALKASLMFGLAAVILVRPCVAQTRTAVPMKAPDAVALDSTRQHYHDTLVMLRDTVASVRWGVEQFQRDLATISRETVLSRASVLIGRCRAMQLATQATERVFDPAKAPDRPPRARAGAASLVRAMGTLRDDLDASCVKGFALMGPGERADTLRAWAGFRGSQVEKALQKYERAVSAFVGAANFRLEPVVRTH